MTSVITPPECCGPSIICPFPLHWTSVPKCMAGADTNRLAAPTDLNFARAVGFLGASVVVTTPFNLY
jgi:hypothetical protein